MIKLLDRRFRLGDFYECEGILSHVLAKVVPPETRITQELIGQYGAIALPGGVVIGSFRTNSNFYHTQSSAILGRSNLPYSELMWLEGVDSIPHQLCWVVGLARLNLIKQLSLLHFPVTQGMSISSGDFCHTRFLHTGDVVATGMLCAHNAAAAGKLKLSRKDLIALCIALGIHDLFTPACGDMMKFIDPKRYDEDAQLTQLLESNPYVDMCDQLEIDPKEPVRICQEKKGVLCKIRDFADTLAYTARDLSMFLGCPALREGAPDEWYEGAEDQMLFEKVWRLQKTVQLTPWEDMYANEDGDLVFTDHQKLHDFLYIRACMFRLLYYNRQTRNIEYLLGIRLVRMLIEEGVLNHDLFLNSNVEDGTIWDKVRGTTGYNPGFLNNGQLGMTHLFHSLDTAKEFVAQEGNDQICGLIYQWPSATKSKVGFWKVIKDGEEVFYNEAYPEDAAGIEKIMTLHKDYFVVLFRREHLHQIRPGYWAKLKQLENCVL